MVLRKYVKGGANEFYKIGLKRVSYSTDLFSRGSNFTLKKSPKLILSSTLNRIKNPGFLTVII